MDKLSRVVAAQDRNITWPSQFLKERTKTAPNLRREVSERGIENEAAMGLFTTLSVLYSGGKLLSKWLNRDRDAAIQNLNEVNSKMATLWGDEILNPLLEYDLDRSKNAARDNSINRIRDSYIPQPAELTWQCELAFRDSVLAARSFDTCSVEHLQILQASLLYLSILEGLYQRNDIGTCSLITDEASYHGWQYNRQNSRTYGEDFGEESCWYGHNNACELFSTIVEHENTHAEEKDSLFNFRIYQPMAITPLVSVMTDILVKNWQVPISYKVPPNSKPANFREDMYYGLSGVTNQQDEADLLYLATPLSKVPENLRGKVVELKNAILNNEADIPSNDGSHHRDPLHRLANKLSMDGITALPSEVTLRARREIIQQFDDYSKIRVGSPPKQEEEKPIPTVVTSRAKPKKQKKSTRKKK